jgi:hypothetical protein
VRGVYNLSPTVIGGRGDNVRKVARGVKCLRLRALIALAVPLAAASAGVVASAAPASAYVSPPCHANATDSTGKAVPSSITIDGTDVWNVSKDSMLSGEGTATTDQISGFAYASVFGYGIIPIAGGNGHGTSGSGSLDVSKIAGYVRVIGVEGVSTSCSGYLTVVVQDDSVLATLAGILSVAVAVVGFLGLAWVGLRSR